MIHAAPVERFDLRMAGHGWDFATAERRRIDAYWREVVAERPYLWNGDVLICVTAELSGGLLSARFAQTDFASFVAWRDWGWPDRAARSCFGVPVVMSSDGALLVGVMGPKTLNEGKVYPPSGSLEPRDIDARGCVNIGHSMAVELREETGLDLAAAMAGKAVAIFEGQRLAVARRYDFAMSFAEIEEAFQCHNAAESTPELARIEAIRDTSQIDARMPSYAQEIIRQFLDAR